MHLAIEAVGAKHSGAATVLLDFLRAAENDPRLSRITVFCSPQAKRDFSLGWSEKLVAVEKPVVERSALARLAWYMSSFGCQVRALDADVALCMSGQGRAIPPIPHVTLIQQSLPFSREGISRLPRKGRIKFSLVRYLMRRSCQTAQQIAVQTPTMAEWVSTAFHLPPDKITVVFPAATTPILADSKAPELEKMRAISPNARFLYVGHDVGYKMVKTIVDGMQILRQYHPEATLFLTIDRESKYADLPGIVCLGRLPGEALHEAYTLCTALVLPSLVETVGLPMIEAMSLGKAVAAADRPYAHDVCGEAAIYFDPLVPQDFADRVLPLMQDAAMRKKLGARGLELMRLRKQSAPYSTFVDIVVSAAQLI